MNKENKLQLTIEQKDVIRNVLKNIKHQQVQRIGGLAGTGKSSIIRTLHQVNPLFACAAYTGKATNVMRQKGLKNATTIHQLIYRPFKDENNETQWGLASKFELGDIEGFTIDEASMVNKEIDGDLRSFGLPIIYIGDHGQLEPIGGTNFNLMKDPDYKLEIIHRNAGEIAHFAEHLRKGNPARKFNGTKNVQVVKESVVSPRHLANTDQVIVAFNKTRVEINQKVREERGIQYSYIAIGEKVICLRNNRKERLFNGMQGIVTKIHKTKDDKFYFNINVDGEEYYKIQYDPDQFGKETNDFNFSQVANPFDYGYSLTCHKVQGSEFDNVIVYEQNCDKWDMARWNYTASSRAKKGLIWIESASFIPNYLKV